MQPLLRFCKIWSARSEQCSDNWSCPLSFATICKGQIKEAEQKQASEYLDKYTDAKLAKRCFMMVL